MNPSFVPVNLNFKTVDEKNRMIYDYGFEITLTQASLPYIPPGDGTRPASQYHYIVYGDTVTIDGYLMNPGKDIQIYARKVIIKDKAFIDTAGPDPDPATDFQSGVAQQQDQSVGAKGTNGADGGLGLPAGKVVMMAESIENPGQTAPGTVLLNHFEVAAILRQIVNDNLNQFVQADPVTFDNFQFTVDPNFSTAAVSDLQCGGLKNITLDYVTWDPALVLDSTAKSYNPNALIALTAANLNLAGTINFTVTLPPFGTMVFPGTFSTTYKVGLFVPLIVDLKTNNHSYGNFKFTVQNSGFNYTINPPQTNDPIWDAIVKQLLAKVDPLLAQNVESLIQKKVTVIVSGFPLSTLAYDANGLMILAKGGRGGKGQNGHDGLKGVQGAPGQNTDETIEPWQSIPQDTFGGNGGPGGQGGDAGHSGVGGAGGNIDMGLVTPWQVPVFYGNAGGDGGPVDMAGNGGPGGDGGAAGSYYLAGPYSRSYQTSAPGSQGPAGAAAAFQGALGAFGPDGVMAVNGSQGLSQTLTYAQLLPFMKVEQLLITEQATSYYFLNAKTAADYQGVMTLANWLVKLTASSVQPGFSPPGWDGNDIDAVRGIHGVAVTMLDNCRRGLDFYGNYQNWVPILTLDSYQTRITQLLTLGLIIETQLQRFTDQKSKAEDKLTALKTAKEKLHTDIDNDQNEMKEMQSQINTLDQTIADLNKQLQEQYTQIMIDERIFTREFQEYVGQQTGCDFSQLINTITGFVTFGSGVKGAIGFISDAYNTMGNLTDEMITFSNALKVIKKVSSTVADIKKGFDQLKLEMRDAKPGQVGMVLSSKEEFDKFIQQFLGKFAAAKLLKDAVDHYFDLINARNQAICAYNALYIGQAKLKADLTMKTSQMEKIAAIISEANPDPDLPACISFMRSSYNRLMIIITRKLYEENRAVWYWSAEESDFSIAEFNMGGLADKQASIAAQIDAAKVRQGGPFQPFTQEVSIAAGDYPIAFTALPTTKKLSFTIAWDSPIFANQFRVIATKVKIELPDVAAPKGVLTLYLCHPGASYQVTPPTSGLADPIQYVHLPRAVYYKIDYTNPHNTGGGQIGDRDYAGLSPLTTWTLDFDNPGNDFLDLTMVKQVKLTFTGTLVGAKGKD